MTREQFGFGLEAVGAFVIAGSAMFFCLFLVMVVLEVIKAIRDGRRYRRALVASIARRRAEAAAGRAAEAALEEDRWRSIEAAMGSVADFGKPTPPPRPVLVVNIHGDPAETAARVIRGIDHTPHRRDHG